MRQAGEQTVFANKYELKQNILFDKNMNMIFRNDYIYLFSINEYIFGHYKAVELLEMIGSYELETILCCHHWNLILKIV